ncbi:hypothetical protein DP116_15395 [Brasilonema bromeliae SPC951]|uniref:Uncharacterized protein n=1 Tax=Brasilonema bromeliae SPC951 TaxID=385972 RepID=A0ABX1P8R2_9CYAN|nr:hypothetical protein [Brasilonema bromeliae SPC951]
MCFYSKLEHNRAVDFLVTGQFHNYSEVALPGNARADLEKNHQNIVETLTMPQRRCNETA